MSRWGASRERAGPGLLGGSGEPQAGRGTPRAREGGGVYMWALVTLVICAVVASSRGRARSTVWVYQSPPGGQGHGGSARCPRAWHRFAARGCSVADGMELGSCCPQSDGALPLALCRSILGVTDLAWSSQRQWGQGRTARGACPGGSSQLGQRHLQLEAVGGVGQAPSTPGGGGLSNRGMKERARLSAPCLCQAPSCPSATSCLQLTSRRPEEHVTFLTMSLFPQSTAQCWTPRG